MVKPAVKSSDNRLDNFEELAQIGSFEINLIDRTWKASRNFCKMLGVQFSSKFTFPDLKSLIHPEFYEDVLGKMDGCIKFGHCQAFECVCVNSNNLPLHMECRMKTVYSEQDIPIKLQGTLQIIAGRKSDERRMNELIEMNKVKDEVLSIVAHDLKSPINQIGGLLNVLRLNTDTSNSEFLNYIENACGIANNIINDLIEISEMNQPGYTLKKSLVDINDLVRATANNYGMLAKEKGITIECKFADEAVALVHPVKISRVLDNLVSNAIKFSHPKREIEITTEALEDKVVVRIIDFGIGIPADKLPFIFDRFTKARQPGTWGEKSTGLGLSIVKNILSLHKGRITVNSRERRGSEFVVELPR